MNREQERPNAGVRGNLPHAIVLAGGRGERLRPVTERWLGEHRPKQYCTFVGTRSMLQHTLDRVKAVVPANNMVTVIAEQHERFVAEAVSGRFPGLLVRQPSDRGTAAGVFLGLAHIVERAPDAPVMLFPCDHFIYPEGRFLQYVLNAYLLCRRFADSLLLFGVPATSPETDYGWIETSPTTGRMTTLPLRRVSRFVEKPAADEAQRLIDRGALWNTMIVAGRARAFWDLGHQLLPGTMEHFELARSVVRARNQGLVDAAQEQVALRRIYHTMPAANFSADFLTRAATSTLVYPVDDLLWSDWGRPKRVMASLRELGLHAPPPLAQAL